MGAPAWELRGHGSRERGKTEGRRRERDRMMKKETKRYGKGRNGSMRKMKKDLKKEMKQFSMRGNNRQSH